MAATITIPIADTTVTTIATPVIAHMVPVGVGSGAAQSAPRGEPGGLALPEAEAKDLTELETLALPGLEADHPVRKASRVTLADSWHGRHP
jgi:hypothetical protein